ncbi:tolloid-like protein 1 isoform X1 [Dendroctonus ponderosae]|uniref:Metalloendopeptidase n=1 Tax=Dendroctonus ponderosae TaxID=77166 RepID=A0AAR5PPE0_DENPD|nr:tolloid-like protein 1 isoform X1 [Dendroctonus ponderosae]
MFSRVAFLLCLYHIAVQSHVLNKTVYNQRVASNSTNTPLVQTETTADKQFDFKNRTEVPSERVANSNESDGSASAGSSGSARLDVNETRTGKSHNRQFSVSELLTTTFPKKTSNDTGLNPCKADVFLDDIAITFELSRKRNNPVDDEEKHKLISDSAKKILEKKKIWKTDALSSSHRIQKRAAATTVKERLWDYGIIPYEIDEEWSAFRKALARQAMRHWENYTCLKFIERNKTENVDFVFFTEKPCGCCSFVGKRGIGAQALSISENCAKFGIVVHEIGHAIGYYHEHTRPDRDNYVQVFEENIMKGQQTNFNKLPTDQVTSLGQKYDYNSIMHYARNTYSINGFSDTIQPIGIPLGMKAPEIGQRVGLSAGDIEQTLILYNCPKCGSTFQTLSGSFSPPKMNVNAPRESLACEWRITATPGEKIILNLTSMDVFKSPNCSTDFVEVRDGHWKKSKLLGRFCGRGDVPNIRSDTNRMLIVYQAATINEHTGFLGNFEVVCGGTMHVTSIGYLASPNYPDDYSPNKECIWKITVPDQYQVALKFLSFDLEHHVECRYDFISIHSGLDKNASHVATLCGQTVPENIVSSSNQMIMKFVSDKSKQRGGFSAKIFAEYNECDRKDHGCEQTCINTLGSYMCACRKGLELHSDKRSCVVPQGPILDACGGTFKAPKGTIASPSFPELYPGSKQCTWIIEAPLQHIVVLNFTHLDVEGNNYDDQLCEYDQVNVSSLLSNGKYKQHGSFCGTKRPSMIFSESNVLEISFGSDDSVQQTGFAAVYYIDPDECSTRNGECEHDCVNTLGSFQCICRTGFTLHENKKDCIEGDCVHEIFTVSTPPMYGIISSPNYPKYYPASKDCAWHIRTLPGHRIRLIFMNFNLESHPECYFDNVQIFDGDSSKSHQKGRYCGPRVPLPIDSTENQLYMTFKSDNNVHKKGFSATYYTLCGGILQASQEKRQIYSHPLYGNASYASMKSCDWFVIGNDGFNVKLSFKEFDLELEEDCSYDYLEVFDGLDSQDSRSLGRFCGNQTSTELTTTEEGVILKFRTDDRIVGRGFILEYELVESIVSLEEYDTPLE